MDKTKQGFVTTGVLILAFLVIYPLERVSYESIDTVGNPFLEETQTSVAGHDWIWNVEAVAFDYMALEVVVIGAVLYAFYWFMSSS
jgi:hypothetical protein